MKYNFDKNTEICKDKDGYYNKPKLFEYLDGKKWVKKQPKNWDGKKESKRIIDIIVLKTDKDYINYLEEKSMPTKIKELTIEIKKVKL